MIKKVLLYILILVNVTLFAQNNTKVDSLIAVYTNASNDSLKIKALSEIAEEYLTVGNFIESRNYINKLLTISKNRQNHKELSQAYNVLGRSYMGEGNFPEALNYYYKALAIFDKVNDKMGSAKMWNNIGLIYMGQENYTLALENYTKCLNVMIELNNERGKGICYNNIGLVNERLKKYEEALNNYVACIEIMKNMNDIYSIAAIQGNIGNVYFSMGNDLYTKDKIKSVDYYEKSLVEYKKSYETRLQLNDVYGIAQCNVNIGRSLLRLGKLNEAKEYLIKGIEISKKHNIKEGLKEGYESLYTLFLEQKEYKNAYENFFNFVLYRDSLINEENSKKTFQIGLQYEFDKKITADSIKTSEEKKIIQAKVEYEKKQKYILYGGLIIVAFLALFLFNRFKVTQEQKEVITLKEQLTQRQKSEIEAQKELVEHKNHEITQSIQYAQKIQNALLPNEEVFRSIFPYSFILFKPKDIVSGDYYWISDKEKYVFYATADCTGHGVPGGFMSMLGTALLNEIVDERKVEDCGEVLTLMREKIMQALKQAGDSESKDGMDMVLIRIDKNTLEMQYAAANNSFYIVSRQETQDMRQEISNLKSHISNLQEMQCDKMPVGVYHSEVKPFRTYTHQLQKGDTIYTYTDGYADQFGGDLSTGSRVKKYTYKRLREKLVAISQEPLAKQKTILENEFESWKGDNEQIDDVCLIGIKLS